LHDEQNIRTMFGHLRKSALKIFRAPHLLRPELHAQLATGAFGSAEGSIETDRQCVAALLP
jgi:hypothetical protein